MKSVITQKMSELSLNLKQPIKSLHTGGAQGKTRAIPS